MLLVAGALSGCAGHAGTPPPTPAEHASTAPAAGLSLVVLGDSIAAGDESGRGASFAQVYADAIAKRTGRMVRVTNLADPAETSATLLGRLRSDDAVRIAVRGADVVTVTVGGNDADPLAERDRSACAPGSAARTCVAAYAPDLEANLGAIVSAITALRAGAPTAVRLTSPDYDPFIGVARIEGVPPFPKDFGLDFYRQAAGAMTDAACRAARARGAECADFLHLFNGAEGDRPATRFLAADHLHPSEEGRRAIAAALLATGLDPLE